MISKTILPVAVCLAALCLPSGGWRLALPPQDEGELLGGREASSPWDEEERSLAGRSDLERLRVCQFREYILPTEAFPLYTGFNCLNYNDHRVFVGDANPAAATCTMSVHNLSVPYPCYKQGNVSLPFDPTDAEAFQEISAKFKKMTDAERWRRCYQASLQCCDRIVTEYGAEQDPSRCPRLWDGWDCWDSAAEGTFETNYCKEYIYSADAAPSCHYPSKKHCLPRAANSSSGARWNQTTDYTGCSTKSRLVAKYTFHAAMLGVSVALSLPAVVVFFCYRRLRIPRIALHRNLLIVIIVRSVLTIWQIVALSFDSLQATDEDSAMDRNGAWCRALSALVQLLSNAVFAMMLAEGVFLHRLIAAAFKSQLNMLYVYSAAAAISILPMIPWTTLRLLKYDYSCWATGADDLDWINNGTRVALLVINFILMLDIVRVLLTKLRGVNSWHSDKIKRTARSTLLLLPLFGVNTLFVADKPSVIPSCDWEAVFDTITHAMEGLQGPCVALLYCYCNNEVKMYVKKSLSDACPKLAAMRGRTWERFARRTFTTNVDDEGGRRGTSSDGGCRNPLSRTSDAPGRRHPTTPGAVAEANEPAEDLSIRAREGGTDLLEERRRRLPGPTFDAWNRFRDEGLLPTDSSGKVASWNIPHHVGGGCEERRKIAGGTVDDAQDRRDDGSSSSSSGNSSSTVSEGSDVAAVGRCVTRIEPLNVGEHRDGSSEVDNTGSLVSIRSRAGQDNRDAVGSENVAPVVSKGSHDVREPLEDSGNFYHALVTPPKYKNVQEYRDHINNFVAEGSESESSC